MTCLLLITHHFFYCLLSGINGELGASPCFCAAEQGRCVLDADCFQVQRRTFVRSRTVENDLLIFRQFVFAFDYLRLRNIYRPANMAHLVGISRAHVNDYGRASFQRVAKLRRSDASHAIARRRGRLTWPGRSRARRAACAPAPVS
jgi:hypothetical protein